MTSRVEHDRSSATAVLVLAGDLDISKTRAVHDQIDELARRDDVRRLVLDFQGVGRLDSAGIAAISVASARFGEAGKHVDVRNLEASHRAALELMTAPTGERATRTERGFAERLGGKAVHAYDQLAALAELIFDAIKTVVLVGLRRRRLPRGAVTEQAVVIGVDALFIIALLSFLLGLIIAFQSAFQLAQFGANIFVANLVGLSMVREFGPMMTGIMLAGRSGSAIAAELATMTVQEEVDALRTMGIDPGRFLVVPRLIALTIVQPALTLMSIFVGILGGFLIATTLLDLSASAYTMQTLSAVSMNDFTYGLVKSVVFAWIIGFTACFTGLQIRGGASAVGKATTRAVVASIFLIIVADSVFATVSTLVKHG
jgi:phospholipid/cholesterol/gamma-HCH transport system permease protein